MVAILVTGIVALVLLGGGGVEPEEVVRPSGPAAISAPPRTTTPPVDVTASPSATTAGRDEPAVCADDAFGCARYTADEPIRVALALSLSGESRPAGLDSSYGVQVAVELRGAVAGRRVELVDADAGCDDAEAGRAAAESIAADGTILAAIGPSCPVSATGALPVLAQVGILAVTPSITSLTLTDPQSAEYGGEWFARTSHNESVQGPGVARFACRELQLTSASTIDDGSASSTGLQLAFAEAFAQECGGRVLRQATIELGATDFRILLAEIAADGPQLLFLPLSNPDGARVIEQTREVAGTEEMILIATQALAGAGTTEAATGAVAEEWGDYFSIPDAPLADAYEATFLPAYAAVSGTDEPLADTHAYAYDAANMIFDTVEAVGVEGEDGTLYVPRTALRDHVRSIAGHEGLTGTLTCDPNGDCADPLVSITQLEGGEFVEIFEVDPR